MVNCAYSELNLTMVVTMVGKQKQQANRNSISSEPLRYCSLVLCVRRYAIISFLVIMLVFCSHQ